MEFVGRTAIRAAENEVLKDGESLETPWTTYDFRAF
jgi:hypothetical protein